MALKNPRLVSISLALLLLAANPVLAQGLDQASAEALAQALRLLQEPALRNPAIANDPEARAIDQQIRSMAGSEQLVQEFYGLAAEIMTELTQNSGGDVKKMSEALERGKADPAALAAMLSPRTLERLRELSVKMSDQRR